MMVAVAATAASACAGTLNARASAAATLRRAAAATANARSFTVRFVSSVEVVYQAPDRVEQVEHGEASSSSSSGGGPPSTSGSYPETITKLFIGDRYYEAAGPTGQAAPFSVSARCPGDTNAADYVLGILRAIEVSTRISPAPDGGFAFTVPKGGAVPVPITGIATVVSGVVATISVNPASGTAPAITISSVDAAPPVTAPLSANESQTSCSSAASGSGTGPASASAGATPP
jgi:hypothetical protein